jgi:hypothetical protein
VQVLALQTAATNRNVSTAPMFTAPPLAGGLASRLLIY